MDRLKLQNLIKKYEDIYLFATKSISRMISEEILADLSIEQFAVLRQLHVRGTLRSSELADILGVNKSAITAKVDRLVQRGLIQRQRDEVDRRNVYLILTEEGRQLTIGVEQKIEHFISFYLNELTEEELETFITLYEKISAIIQKKTVGSKNMAQTERERLQD